MRYQNDLAEFERYLIDQEKSRATVSKYLRDTKGLLIFLDGRELSKELMVEYKNLLAKGDLFRNTATIAEKYYGYKVSVIDLRNPTRSSGYNMLYLG